jgi:FAD synthetase
MSKKILVGGTFNTIHPGHVYFLKKAKSLGDELIVVLTNDKNNNKPYAKPAEQRKRNLEKLDIADKIIIGDEKDCMKVVEREKPDIIALGYDQRLPWSDPRPECKIVRLEKFGEWSTAKILKKKC